MSATPLHGLLAYCRPGFEGECVQEFAALDAQLGGAGHARARTGSGLIEYRFADAEAAANATPRMSLRHCTFARQVLNLAGLVDDLPKVDRIGALMPLVDAIGAPFHDAFVEAPDNDAARNLAGLCRSLNNALVAHLKRERRIDPKSPLRLHVCLADAATAYVAVADIAHASPWPGGIARLRFPHSAPSRSTLKLEEAFLTLLDADERTRWLQAGLRAVDLGASPGGWTWQFVRRQIAVTAVDNGPMDAELMASGLVTHLREDGFRYRPSTPVDWLVCDMVEQPRRVAAMIGSWLADGACRRAIFNLKLPMKKRYDEVQACRDVLEAALSTRGHKLDWRARHLYHDREEVTVFAQAC